MVGIRDGRLAEKLQLAIDSELTLKKAVIQARQSEAVKKQQSTVREELGEQPTAAVGEVRRYKPKVQANTPGSTCYRCGRSPPHAKQQCPAREATCNKCHKKGHY